MTNKEKFKNLIAKEKTNTVLKNKERIRNRARLRESQVIALKVLKKLYELGWSQRTLAEKLKVTPQQVSKIVRGKENLTLETQVKLQQVLDIPILASYYEKKFQAFSFDGMLNFDFNIPAYKPEVSSSVPFFKEKFKKGLSLEPIMVVVDESNYQMAS